MSITEKEVTKMARLSKIEISATQKPELAKKIGTIIDWMASLNEVQTNNIEPLANVHQMALPLAEDRVSDGDIAERVLQNAPSAKYNYFTVPKVIE